MINRVRSYIYIFGFLLLIISVASVYSANELNLAYSEERALAEVVSDPEGDVDNTTVIELDLVAAWMGSDEDHLFFVVKYDFMSSSHGFVNVTLRTETNDLFLIMVFASPDFGGIYMTHATSLVGTSKNIGEECYFVSYDSPNRVQRNVDEGEISFYIDWDHIGKANQEVAVVFWSGLSHYEHYDKMPNQSFISYVPAIADRNVLFNFDTDEIINEDIDTSEQCQNRYKDTGGITYNGTETIVETSVVYVTQTETFSDGNLSTEDETTQSFVIPVDPIAIITPFILGIFIMEYRSIKY